MPDTARQEKLRQMDVAISYSPERRAFIQGYQEFHPYYRTREHIRKGMYVGMVEVMQDGRWYRLCQSHEPNKSGQDYGIEPGYATYWAGPEITAINVSGGEKLIPSFESGDMELQLRGLDVAYEVGSFKDGYLKVTGGTFAIGYQMLLAGNDEPTPNKDDSTKWDMKVRFYTPLPFGIDTSASTDVTGFHIQGNKFGCQRQTVPAQDDGSNNDRYDYPKLYTGHSLVPVPYKHFYWAVVGGPGVGILQVAMTNVRVGNTELTPFSNNTASPGDDAGKLVAVNGHGQQHYARIDIRSEADFNSDAVVPIFIYPK